MARIPAGTTELRNAFWQHIRKEPSSEHLRLFYAIECGLKSVYLRWHRLSTTDQIRNSELQDGGHDLAKWVKELRLPASIVPSSIEFRLKRDGSRYRIELAHQAWRYGVSIEENDEAALLAYLQKLQDWIQEALAR